MICSWLLHPGSRWMPNVFISNKIGSQWWTVLGHPELIECMGSVFWAWRMDLNKGVPTLFAYCEELTWNFYFNSTRVRAHRWPLLGIFSGFFWFFWGGSVGQIICRDDLPQRRFVVFRGSNISRSLACSNRKTVRLYTHCNNTMQWVIYTFNDARLQNILSYGAYTALKPKWSLYNFCNSLYTYYIRCTYKIYIGYEERKL